VNETKTKYRVDEQLIDGYLKRRLISVSVTAAIAVVISLSMLAFILYRQGSTGLWSLFISAPIIAGAFLYGVKLWNDKFRALANTEFVLTAESIIQVSPDHAVKKFKFSEIAVINKQKFGTVLVKGSLFTKVDYYRPKRINPYQLGDPTTIFIPTITTNYSELIAAIRQCKQLNFYF
jgi:hypothetical protein